MHGRRDLGTLIIGETNTDWMMGCEWKRGGVLLSVLWMDIAGVFSFNATHVSKHPLDGSMVLDEICLHRQTLVSSKKLIKDLIEQMVLLMVDFGDDSGWAGLRSLGRF